MIRKLQWKMVAIIAGILLLVFGVVFATLNLFMQRSSVQQTTQVLELIARQDGLEEAERFDAGDPDGGISPREQPPGSDPNLPEEGLGPEILRSSRIFYVKLNTGGTPLEVQIDRMFDFTEQDAEDYALTAYGRTSDSGTIDGYQYLVQEKDYGYIAVFAERGIETQMLSQLMEVSLWVAGVTFAVLILVSIFLSRWAVRPVKTAFDKQRQFVSDASHELKTPLAVIASNVDMLQECGESLNDRELRWLDNIRASSDQMTYLVEELLTLARAENDQSGKEQVRETVPLSDLVTDEVLLFEPILYEAGKELDDHITENLLVSGDPGKLRRLVNILLDNARKYADSPSVVTLRLEPEGAKRVRLTVNTKGDPIPHDQLERIFERFYRADQARSSEGFGLGLSIASQIAQEHGGRLWAESSLDEGNTFLFSMPRLRETKQE